MPQPTAQEKERYSQELAQVANRFVKLEDSTIRGLVGLLQETRQNIAAMILAGPTEAESARLRQLQNNIDLIVDDFSTKLGRVTRAGLSDSLQIAQDGVALPLKRLGIDIGAALNTILPQQANVVADFNASLVQDISDDLRRSINTALRRAVLAEQGPFNTMRQITQALGVKAQDGVWGFRRRPEIVTGVAARAEAITRTELTRIYNLSTHSTQQAAATVSNRLKKSWVATPRDNTRESHIRAHREYARRPIPINEPFRVGRDRLMYPGDPKGSAAETINCRCSMITIVDGIGRPDLPIDKRIDDELARRQGQRAAQEKARPADRRKVAARDKFTPQTLELRQQHAQVTQFAEEFLADDLDGRRNLIADSRMALSAEEGLSRMSRKFGYVPGNMTNEDWLALADDLETQTGRDLRLSTQTRRDAVGNKARGKATDIAQVGGQDRLVRSGAVTAKDARRLVTEANQEAREAARKHLDRRLTRLGYPLGKVKDLNLEQKRRLLAEIGHGTLQRGNIARLPKGLRQQVIDNAGDDERLDALAAAKSPMTAKGLDTWELYREALKRGGVEDPAYIPDEIFGDEAEAAPSYVLRPGG